MELIPHYISDLFRDLVVGDDLDIVITFQNVIIQNKTDCGNYGVLIMI